MKQDALELPSYNTIRSLKVKMTLSRDSDCTLIKI